VTLLAGPVDALARFGLLLRFCRIRPAPQRKAPRGFKRRPFKPETRIACDLLSDAAATAMRQSLCKAVATPIGLCYIAHDFNASVIAKPRAREYITLPACHPLGERDRAKDIGRVDVAEPASISTGIAGRYASAVFDLSKDDNALMTLEADVDALDAALTESDDFRTLIASPLYSREAQSRAVGAIAAKMGLSVTVSHLLSLLAQKRRLFVLPHLLTSLRAKLAAEKGEVTAEVASAKALTKTQSDRLAKTLSAKVGSDVKIKATVDESLIGGLVVKVGSKMIDTSIASKLKALQNTMKEVG
jgi:F-type H+-transporting ATPase subunit delta